MGLFDGPAKKDATENLVMQQIARFPIINDIVNEIVALGNEEKTAWLLKGQGYYDTCVRNVIIEADSLTISWTSAITLSVLENGSDTKEEITEGEFAIESWSFTKSGYVPLHKHYNDRGRVDVPLTRVCYLFASLVREQMMAKLPGVQFNSEIYAGGNCRASFTYLVPRSTLREWF